MDFSGESLDGALVVLVEGIVKGVVALFEAQKGDYGWWDKEWECQASHSGSKLCVVGKALSKRRGHLKL